MNETNKTSIRLVIAFVAVVVLFTFFGGGAMMGATIDSGAMVLEITTMIAMIVYAIVAWVIGRLIWLTMRRTR